MSDNLTQSVRSAERSISSAAQKEALAFLYICQMSLWWMGKSRTRCGFSWSSGSGASPSFSAILCCDDFFDGSEAFLAFFMVWAVLVQNSTQSSPLLWIKLVISQKAWYDMGMF